MSNIAVKLLLMIARTYQNLGIGDIVQYNFDGQLHTPIVEVEEVEEVQFVTCHSCGSVGEFETGECDSEQLVHCEDCVVNVCPECGYSDCREDGFSFSDELSSMLCETCYDNCHSQCNAYRCGTVGLTENMLSNEEGDFYCQDCYYEIFSTCENCSEECYNNSMVGEMCEYCAENSSESGHDYSYKPSPIFHGKGNIFMGVELEVDKGQRQVCELVAELSELDQDENQFYLKQDGSLDDGLEIVTHPATLKAHMREMPWKAITDTAKNMKFQSHNAKTCGLHVHVGRTGLGKTVAQQEHTIDNLIAVFWKLEEQLFTFSRRENADLSHWAPFNHKGVEAFNPIKAFEAKNNRRRYQAINVTNAATIEFRLFRGTLKLNTVKATIQLVDTLVRMSRDYSLAYIINKLTWKDVINFDKNNKALATYSEERGI